MRPSDFFISSLCFCVLLISCEPPKASLPREIPLETKKSGQANMFKDHEGTLHLSWLEQLNDTLFSLRYSSLVNGQWNEPTEIAQSSSWFVNWADFPSLIRSHEGWWAAHWLQMSGEGTFDYDVHISTSRDGITWAPSFVLHTDSVRAEHGFVSLLPTDDGRILGVWLDGRHTGTPDTSVALHTHGHNGTMTLRAARFDREGRLSHEIELDNKICDCCQTDLTMTPNGPIVVYRDRDDNDIRDISVIRGFEWDWTQARKINDDQWYMPACPVNGPAIDALDDLVAVVWYTESDFVPKVMLTISKDRGASFGPPIIIDNTLPLGRVDVIIGVGEIIVTWLDTGMHTGALKLRRVSFEGEMQGEQTLHEMSSSRKSGFPIAEKYKDHLIMAWVEVSDNGQTRVRTLELNN